MVFEDRILVNPRLLKLKNPTTGEVINFEVQDYEPEEIVQEGTEINAQVMNEIQTPIVDNLNSTSATAALSANQGKVLKEMIDKHSIFCKLPSEITTTTSYTNISTWQQVQKIGTGLSLSNGVVKIGAGVNTIKISCRVRIYNNDKKDFYGYLKHNQANINESWIVKTVAGPAYDVVEAQAIISVSENDTITFSHYGEGFYIQATSTTLLVEKIN